MNKLLNDALRAKGYAGPDIKMVLTDVEDPNGPYYTDTLTNVVVFDRKKLANSNRNEILNALGHEFGHYSKEDNKPDYHKGWGTTLFMNRNLLLALKGDWEALKKRSLIFLNDVPSGHKKYILTHEFYLALSEANVDEMKKALKPIMDPKKGKILARDTFYDLEFYLQPQLLLFGKIASIHGYNLEIDLDIAPKELIKYQPLTVKEYEEADKEYPLITKYDFKEPFINWIAKMTQIEEEYKSGRK